MPEEAVVLSLEENAKDYFPGKNKQQEIDAILEKIHKKGMKSLTKKEKDTLAAYSSGIR